VEVSRPDRGGNASALRRPLPFDCVVTPIGEDRWVTVLGLDHVFVVRDPERVEDAAPAEIQRMLGALDPEGERLLELLPPGIPRLVEVAVPVARGHVDPATAVDLRRRITAAAKRKQAREVLDSVAQALHLREDALSGPPIVGREAELATVDALLSAKTRNALLLVGPELVGKSALVVGWLRLARERGETPLVYATSGAQLIAGMSGLGQWQERVRRVMDAAAELDAVLWFENLGDLFGSGGDREDLASALRPWLDDRSVRLVGELRPESVALHERRHPGFFEGLHRVRVPPLDATRTTDVLRAAIAHAAASSPDRVRLADDAVPSVVDLCERYLPYRAFPGKAVRLAHELSVLHAEDRDAEGRPVRLGPGRVRAGFSLQTGIPEVLLDTHRPLDLEAVAAFFHARIVGQRAAIDRLVDLVAVIKSGLQPRGKPLATLLFAGPTGVGKTELARALATYLFGSPERLTRFDMSEYMDAWAAERLIRGADGREGALTRRVRTTPFSVLLLDEIEKAHDSVFDLLLQVLGEGRLTDAAGRTASFENAIIIMTSNLGAGSLKRPIGIAPVAEDLDAHYVRAVSQAFRPELVNRIDRVLPFAPLSQDEVAAITRLAIDQIAARRALRDDGRRGPRVALRVDDAAVAALAAGGYAPRYGARALRRHLERALVAPLAAELLFTRPAGQRVMGIDVGVDDRGVLTITSALGAVSADSSGPLEDVQRIRREAGELVGLEAVTEQRERLTWLESQLSSGSASNVPRLVREHARLEHDVRSVMSPWSELVLLEDLGLTGVATPRELEAERPTAERLYRQVASGIFALLANGLDAHDAATVMIVELTPRALDRWLPELLAGADGRGWSVALHRHGTRAKAVDADGEVWPPDRPWHPAQSPEDILDWLAGQRPDHASLILRVHGPKAGLLLHLESGHHRWLSNRQRDVGDVLLTTLHPTTEVPAAAWTSMAFEPPPPHTRAALAKLPVMRSHNLETGMLSRRDSPEQRWMETTSLPYGRYWPEVEAVAVHPLVALAREDALDGFAITGTWTPPSDEDEEGFA